MKKRIDSGRYAQLMNVEERYFELLTKDSQFVDAIADQISKSEGDYKKGLEDAFDMFQCFFGARVTGKLGNIDKDFWKSLTYQGVEFKKEDIDKIPWNTTKFRKNGDPIRCEVCQNNVISLLCFKNGDEMCWECAEKRGLIPKEGETE